MPRTPKPRRWRPGVLKNLLQRDVVDMLVLILLNRRAMYGREIIRYLAALTDNVLIYDKLNVPLSRLERQGFIYTVKGRGNFVAYDEKLLSVRKEQLFAKLRELVKEAGEIGVEAGELAGWLLGGQEKLGSAGREGE